MGDFAVNSGRNTLFILGFIAAVSVFVFQNCSGGSTIGAASGSTVANQALTPLGMPVEMTINQLSFMSCANAGATATINADPLSTPYYHFRFGAYNNTGSGSSSNLSSATNMAVQPFFASIPGSLVGGINFTQTAMASLSANSGNVTPTQMLNTLNTSPFSINAQPVVAMIYPNGARSGSLAPTYSTTTTTSSAAPAGSAVAATLLQPLANSTMATALANSTAIPNGGTAPISYFSSIGGPAGTLAGSLSFPISDMASLGQSMNNVLLFFGYSDITGTGATGTSASMIQNLVGPDLDPTKRLFGHGYQLVFTTPNSSNPAYFFAEGGPLHANDLTSNASYPLNNQVRDFDLNPPTGTQAIDVTTTSKELWDCFHLDIVRDVDRKYWTVTAQVNIDLTTGQACTLPTPTTSVTNGVTTVTPPTPGNCATAPAGAPIPRSLVNGTSFILQENYFQNAAQVQNLESEMIGLYQTHANGANPYLIPYTVYTGTVAACPTEDPTTLNARQLDKLRIARRFLPAEQWEVNITYGCAVPLAAATSSGGECYLNGDTDPSKLIQYSASLTALASSNLSTSNLQTLCGAGHPGECPATISFCARYQ